MNKDENATTTAIRGYLDAKLEEQEKRINEILCLVNSLTEAAFDLNEIVQRLDDKGVKMNVIVSNMRPDVWESSNTINIETIDSYVTDYLSGKSVKGKILRTCSIGIR